MQDRLCCCFWRSGN